MNEKTITPEDLVGQIRDALPNTLKSAILYGSAVSGDFVAKRSDYNVLLVLETLGVAELKALAKPARAWMKAGNPPPLCFTTERLINSADVFPLELLDIKEQRRVLWGVDVVADIAVSPANLRHQLEYELKSKLLHLRESYLGAEGNARQTVDLLVNSLSTFLILFRGALRLFREDAKVTKLEAARLLGEQLEFAVDVFEVVHDLKTGERSVKEVDADDLFQRYLSVIETVVDKVDRHLRSSAV